MFSGYWIVPWNLLPKLPIRAERVLGLFAFLLMARRRERIPAAVRVVGLDTLLRGTDSVETMTRLLRGILASAPTGLWRGRVVLLPVDHIRLDAQWTIQVRRQEGEVDVPIKSLFPRADLASVGGHTLCYSPLIII